MSPQSQQKCHKEYSSRVPSNLTLPALKRRGFLDLRPALNLRIQVSNSVRSLAVSEPKSRQNQDFSSVYERPSGLVSLGV
ncbi:hypothetical protein [Moorena producens]|uniref:hypothetical protein n=1 Tax=Moorena producens TaxID=1155739 RepID=UPI0011EA6796|nr:hypothetical protein [Moorena producens]